MHTDVDEVLQEVLALPEADRVRVLEAVLATIDNEASGSSEAEWATEFARRAREVDEGGVKAVAWDEVRRELLSIVDAHRAR